MEIERKFVLGEPPDLSSSEGVQIEQGYLALARTGGAEVRLRRAGERLLLTVKGGAGKARTEEELPLESATFDSLWPLTEGRRLRKRRFRIPIGDLTAEVDLYGGDLEGLVTAEVEFADEGEANRFEPPEWLGREVTGDDRYASERLATDGAPGVRS